MSKLTLKKINEYLEEVEKFVSLAFGLAGEATQEETEMINSLPELSVRALSPTRRLD